MNIQMILLKIYTFFIFFMLKYLEEQYVCMRANAVRPYEEPAGERSSPL